VDPLELFAMHASELDRLQIGYFVTGSVATMAFGEMRQTADIDVVVHLEHDDAEAICACFPEPEFYVSLEVVERAIARADQFNVLHPSSGFKIDFMVSSMSEFDRSRFARTRKMRIPSGEQIRFASPEDVIIKKLEYFKMGGSDKHLRDIAGVLRVLGEGVDRGYIVGWAERLELVDQWEMARSRADAP
jgi:hypothetical protein